MDFFQLFVVEKSNFGLFWPPFEPHFVFLMAPSGLHPGPSRQQLDQPSRRGVQTQETKYDGADYDYDADDDDEGDNDGNAHDGVCDFGADERRW